MKIESLYWKEHLSLKILEKHAVLEEEVEEVIYDSVPEVRRQGQGRYCIYGQSCAGRYLMIVLDEESEGVFVPVTARDMTEKEKKAFKKRRK